MPTYRSSRPIVLLLTHSADHFTVDRVAAAVLARDAEPIRVNTDEFPLTLRIAAHFDPSADRFMLARGGEPDIDSRAVRAVWLRRLGMPRFSDDLEPRFRDLCTRESEAALRGFLGCLAEARWIDPLPRIRDAQDKLAQLRAAKRHGLDVPATLVTNDASQARRFFDELNGNVVAKMLTPAVTSMGRPSVFVYTTEVTAEDLADAERLRYCPMVFQQRIPKAHELRAIFVSGRLFAGEIDASQTAAAHLDWRRAAPGECRWENGDVPPDVARRMGALMQELGLAFGAFDLIVTPDGRHVFLEVNPTGEWGMLERDLDLPISAAIAEALLAR